MSMSVGLGKRKNKQKGGVVLSDDEVLRERKILQERVDLSHFTRRAGWAIFFICLCVFLGSAPIKSSRPIGANIVPEGEEGFV
jgi:hypothetical protein